MVSSDDTSAAPVPVQAEPQVTRHIRMIWLVSSAILLVISLLTAGLVRNEYHNRITYATQAITDKLTLFSHSAELVFGNTDALLMAFVEKLANAKSIDDDDLAAILATKPEARALLLLNPTGIVIADSRIGQKATGINVSDRPYFKYHLEPGVRSLFIGPPALSRLNNEWSIPISRSVKDSAGALKYVVVLSISPKYFEKVISSVSLFEGEQGALLLRDDRTVLASIPHYDAQIGHQLARAGGPLPVNSRQWTRIIDDSGSALIWGEQELQSWPFTLVYSTPLDSALAEYRSTRTYALLALAVLTFITLAFVYQLCRRVQSKSLHTIQLSQANAQLNQEVSEKTKLAESLQHSNERLEHAVDELTQFSYRVSHDLRSPISSSLGLIPIIADDIANSDLVEANNSLRLVEGELTRLNDLIADILELSRADLSSQPTEIFDLAQLIDAVVEHEKRQHSGVSFIVDIDQASRSMRSRKIRVQQICYNLISNAAKYADPSKTHQQVVITVKSSGETIQLSIRDNGLGIPRDIHDKIYDLFFRHHVHAAGGTGMGLAIVKKHLTYLGGDISLQSADGETIFTVRIPQGAEP